MKNICKGFEIFAAVIILLGCGIVLFCGGCVYFSPEYEGSKFFCGEGPRSRCYGRTAALRFIVQPFDEND
jgi:hypothetical protein